MVCLRCLSFCIFVWVELVWLLICCLFCGFTVILGVVGYGLCLGLFIYSWVDFGFVDLSFVVA